MKEIDLTSEDKILEAAEKEFLEKGYDKAKISDIAKNAGVNHALIHYYFRTKENIFNIIFKNKIEMLAKHLGESFDDSKEFSVQLENAIDSHFNFVEANPNIVFFVMREVSTDSEQLKVLRNHIKQKIENVLSKLETMLTAEMRKGTIRPTTAIDLLMNIISLNVGSVLVFSVLQRVKGNEDIFYTDFLKNRKEHVKHVIINSLRI